jgi:cation transport regulator ChaB
MDAHVLVLRVDWGLEAHPHDVAHAAVAAEFADDDGVS